MRKQSVQETIAKLEIEELQDQIGRFQKRYQNYEKKQILLNDLADLSKTKCISLLFKEKPFLTTIYMVVALVLCIAFLIGNIFIFIFSPDLLQIILSVVLLSILVTVILDVLKSSSVYVRCIFSKDELLFQLTFLERKKQWCIREIEELQRREQSYAQEKE